MTHMIKKYKLDTQGEKIEIPTWSKFIHFTYTDNDFYIWFQVPSKGINITERQFFILLDNDVVDFNEISYMASHIKNNTAFHLYEMKPFHLNHI